MGRIGNKKSRNGCIRCKNRRVKCDEVRPACGWCASHSYECEYPTRTDHESTRTLRESSTSTEPTIQRAQSSSVPVPVVALASASTESGQARLELGLFQYYVYTVARTFPYVDKDRGLELHADIVPQASLRCSNLLNVMYSYALLHLHIQSSSYGIFPRNLDFFQEVGLSMGGPGRPRSNQQVDALSLHMDYLDRALQGQRDVASEINYKNADGLCMAAVLLAQVALVHSSQMKLDLDYCIPSDWFRLQSSFSTCLAISRPLLSMDSATSMMIHSPPTIDNRDLDYQVPAVFRELLDWEPENSADHMSHQARETYRKCIVYIESIHKRIADKEPWQSLGRRVLAFPSVGTSAFFALLESHQPRALVILAHLLAMTKRLDASWWVFEGVADYHVRGIATLVSNEWQWAMQWPMRVLETGAADGCFSPNRHGGSEMTTPF